MYTKICPSCGYRNLPSAMVCANGSCAGMLRGVEIVEINDAGDQVPGPVPSESTGAAPVSMPSQPGSARRDIPYPQQHSRLSTAILTLVIPSVVVTCLAAVIVGITGASGSMDFGSFLAILAGTCVGTPLLLSPFWMWGWLWLFPLIDCLKHEPTVGNDRLTWTLLCILLPLGGTLYLLIRRPQRIMTIGH